MQQHRKEKKKNLHPDVIKLISPKEEKKDTVYEVDGVQMHTHKMPGCLTPRIRYAMSKLNLTPHPNNPNKKSASSDDDFRKDLKNMTKQ